MFGCNFKNCRVHRLPIQVYADDGFCRRGDCGFKCNGVEGVVVLLNFDELRCSTNQIDTGCASDVRMTGDNDFVSMPHIQCMQCCDECNGSIATRCASKGPAISSPFRTEGFRFWTFDPLAGCENAVRCFQHFIIDEHPTHWNSVCGH